MFLWGLADIYLGVNVVTGEKVAMKLESTKSKHPQLVYEAKLYKILQGAVGASCGVAMELFCDRCMEMTSMVLLRQLLGPLGAGVRAWRGLSPAGRFALLARSLSGEASCAPQRIDESKWVFCGSFPYRDPLHSVVWRRGACTG